MLRENDKNEMEIHIAILYTGTDFIVFFFVIFKNLLFILYEWYLKISPFLFDKLTSIFPFKDLELDFV